MAIDRLSQRAASEPRSIAEWVQAVLMREGSTTEKAALLRWAGTRTWSVAELSAAIGCIRAGAGVRARTEALYVCGSGGATIALGNISTMASVLASCYVPVVKIGDRGVTHRRGSADLLEEMGADVDELSSRTGGDVERCGLGFALWGPDAWFQSRTLREARRMLKSDGVIDMLRILGPLSAVPGRCALFYGGNGAGVAGIVLRVARALEVGRALVVYNTTGIDEMAPIGENRVATLEADTVRWEVVTARQVGVEESPIPRVTRHSAAAEWARAVLQGRADPMTNGAVTMTAGAMVYAAGVVGTIADGIHMTRDGLDRGIALQKWDAWLRGHHQLLQTW